MSDRIYEGYFFKSYHVGDNKKVYRHSFLAIGIAKNKVVALQFSSVKYDEENNYESKFSNDEEFTPTFFPLSFPINFWMESNIVDADITDGLEIHSQANIDKLFTFDFNNQDWHDFKLINECKNSKWKEIINKLQKNKWNNNFIDDMVQKWKY